MRAHRKKLESSLVNAWQLKMLVNASQNLTLLMIKQKYFVHNPFHVIADVNDDMFQPESKSSFEDDKILRKVPLVSIGAENKVSLQSGARIQKMETRARKEDTNFSMGQCWF